jgi:hypothetical protein
MVGGSLVVFFIGRRSRGGGFEKVWGKGIPGARARLGSRPDAERTSGGRTNAERLLARLPSKGANALSLAPAKKWKPCVFLPCEVLCGWVVGCWA